ncbi:MAG: hypothetical protein WCW77_00370 [Patescibacteria group bacterium]|jgi:hypothetical protein
MAKPAWGDLYLKPGEEYPIGPQPGDLLINQGPVIKGVCSKCRRWFEESVENFEIVMKTRRCFTCRGSDWGSITSRLILHQEVLSDGYVSETPLEDLWALEKPPTSVPAGVKDLADIGFWQD